MEDNTSKKRRIKYGAALFIAIIIAIEHPHGLGSLIAEAVWALAVYYIAILAIYVVRALIEEDKKTRNKK